MNLYGMDGDDVVISGQALWFPGVNNFSALSSKLVNSFLIPPNSKLFIPVGFRDEMKKNARILKEKYLMDHIFIGINSIIAESCNLVTRKLYEKVFEALLDAGLNPKDVHDIVCDVYQNNMFSDGELADLKVPSKEVYTITGRSRAMEANRLSFFLNAKGCSVSQDAGYLGGLLGVQSATNAIRKGRADIALVASGNISLDHSISYHFDHLGWLSKDGNTSAFDNEASGFVRSEGVAVLVLQRAKNAKRIYAKIKHCSLSTEIKHFSPSKQTQSSWEKSLSQFYAESKIPVNDISYLEAYGSGVKDMDSAELNAVTNVMCKDRDSPLLIGSIKSNIGHLESAADLASIVKAMIIFDTGVIPKNESYSSPNRNVHGLINGKLKVVEKPTPLPEKGLIAISGWHFGGIYGHIVLERFNKPKQSVQFNLEFPRLVPLAARTDEHVGKVIEYLENLPYDAEYLQLVTDVFSRKIERYLGRGYVLLPKPQDQSVSSFQPSDDLKPRPLWFVFSGMGSQWVEMGKTLLTIPIIRKSIEKSHEVLLKEGIDLIHIITTDDKAIFDNILNSFVGIASIQIALVDLLVALKITPDGMVGHSVGELGCAYADGTLSAEQMILAAYYRGKASQAVSLIKGTMAAVGMGYNQIKKELPEGVEVACHNSDSSCTLSGPAEPVENYVKDLTARGVFARAVNVANIAYHSSCIRPAAPFLLEYMKKIITEPKARSSKWISSSVPEEKWDSDLAKWCSPEYLTNNLLSSVLFEEACKHIPEDAILLEIAPHGLLQAILKRTFTSAIHIPLTSRLTKDSVVYLLEAIGRVYISGYEIDLSALYPKLDYPVSRKTPIIQPLIHWVRAGNARSNGREVTQNLICEIRSHLKAVDPSMTGIEVAGRKMFPVSTYIHLLEKLNQEYADCLDKRVPLTFTDFFLKYPAALCPEYTQKVDASILQGKQMFEVGLRSYTAQANEIFVLAGNINVLEENSLDELPPADDEVLMTINKQDFYSCIKKHGCSIPETMQSFLSVNITEKGLNAKLPSTISSNLLVEALLQLPMFDACSQGRMMIFPKSIRKLDMDPTLKTKNTELLAVYDRALDVVRCEGMSISGIRFEEIVPLESPLTFHSIKTVPFGSPSLKCIEEFVEFSCTLIKHSNKAEEEIKVLVLEDLSSTTAAVIECILPSSKVVLSEEDSSVSASGYDLVVCGNYALPTVASTAIGYILVCGNMPIKVPVDFVEVSTFTSNKEKQLWLLKKKIILNGERDFIVIPQNKDALLSEISTRRHKSSALLVGLSEPLEGISEYQEAIQSQIDVKLKWLFVLDKDAPRIDVTNPLYREQLEKGLPLNVLLNGQWHFVYKSRLCGFDSGAYGTNLYDQIQLPHTKVDHPKNNLVMGVLSEGCENQFDPHLTWTIPTLWNQEDAASVPIAYSLAYHCLKVIGNLRPYECVLVTDGLHVKAQAAIAVALSVAERVFVTVSSNEEAAQLNAIFPKLNADDILLHSDKHVGLKLKLIAGSSSPHVIYNLLDGAVFQSCFQYIAQFGRTFHFGQEDIIYNNKVGMGTFLRSISLYAVNEKQINNWPETEKKQVRSLVAEGLRRGIVKPPTIITKTENDVTYKTGSKTHKIQHLASKWQRGSQFLISSTGTYVVIGASSDAVLDIVEWLVRRGGKNILICNPSHISDAQYQRKVKGLNLRRKTNIHIYEEQTLKKTMKEENIDAIFFVNLVEHGVPTEWTLFDEILSSDLKHLVTISRTREYILKMHKTTGILGACTNIIWQADDDLILQSMDLVSPYFSGHSTIAITNSRQQWLKKRATEVLGECIPESVDSYLRLGQSFSTVPELIEIPTSGLRNDALTELPPVVFFPGFTDDPVKLVEPIARNILYSAFVAAIPHSGFMSVPSVAASLLPAIKAVGRYNNYNLVGLLTGCPIAIEVTRQLESQGARVSLLLVEDPTMILQLGLQGKDQLQAAFLDAVSALSPKQDEMLQSTLPWPTRMNHLVSCMELPPSTDCWIRKAANFLCDHFSSVLDYNLDHVRILGPLAVIRSVRSGEHFNYNKLCVNNLTWDLDLTFNEMMAADLLKKYINRVALTVDVTPRCSAIDFLSQFEELLKHRIKCGT